MYIVWASAHLAILPVFSPSLSLLSFFPCPSTVYCLGTATDRIAARLRRELFDSYMGTDIELYDAEKNGEMVRKSM